MQRFLTASLFLSSYNPPLSSYSCSLPQNSAAPCSPMLPISSSSLSLSSPIDPQPSTYSKKAAELGVTKLCLPHSSVDKSLVISKGHQADQLTLAPMVSSKFNSSIKSVPVLTSVPVIPSIPSTPSSLSPKKRKAGIVNLTISADGRAMVETVPNPDLYADGGDDDDDDDDDDSNLVESPDYTSDDSSTNPHLLRRKKSVSHYKGIPHRSISRMPSNIYHQSPHRASKTSNIDDAITALKQVIARNKSNGGVSSPTIAGSLFDSFKPPKKKSCNPHKPLTKNEPKTPISKPSSRSTTASLNIPQTPQSVESNQSIKTPTTHLSLSCRTNESSSTPLHLSTFTGNHGKNSSQSSLLSSPVALYTGAPLSQNDLSRPRSHSEAAAALAIDVGLDSPRCLAPEPEIKSDRDAETLQPGNHIYSTNSSSSFIQRPHYYQQPLQPPSGSLNFASNVQGPDPNQPQQAQFWKLPLQPLQHNISLPHTNGINIQPLSNDFSYNLAAVNNSTENVFAFQTLPFHNQLLPMEGGRTNLGNPIPTVTTIGQSYISPSPSLASSSSSYAPVAQSGTLPLMSQAPLPMAVPVFMDINNIPVFGFPMDSFQNDPRNFQDPSHFHNGNQVSLPVDRVEGITIQHIQNIGDYNPIRDTDGGSIGINQATEMYQQPPQPVLQVDPGSSMNMVGMQHQQELSLNFQPVDNFHSHINSQPSIHSYQQPQQHYEFQDPGTGPSDNTHLVSVHPIERSLTTTMDNIGKFSSGSPVTFEYPQLIPSPSASFSNHQHFHIHNPNIH